MRKINFKNFWVLSLFVFFLFALFIVWIFFVGLKADRGGAFYNKGHNAIWVAHEWAQEAKTDREIQNLVILLTAHDINTIYLHVGPLRPDGKIDPNTYEATLNFVEKVKYQRADMKILAWMGQVRNKLDLADESVRRNILNMCMIFTKMIGMDGVHYDIEPVWDEDEDFIKLLGETREVLDTGTGVVYGDGGAGSSAGTGDSGDSGADSGQKILSVALAEFIPNSFVWWTENVAKFQNYNTEKNYLNVAAYADQIVDMVYDTGIDRDFLYKWFVKEQVVWVSDLMDEDGARGTDLLIGVPVYDEAKMGFNPEVENIGNALLGVINGLNDIRASHENFTGIAIYPEWEMDEKEWEIYDGLWK